MVNIISDSAAVPSDWTGAHYCSWKRVLRQDSRNARNQRWVVVNIYKYVLLCKVQKRIQFQFLTNMIQFWSCSFNLLSQHIVLCPSCFECCFTKSYNSKEEDARRGQSWGSAPSHLNRQPNTRGGLTLDFSKKRNKVAPMDSDQDAVSVHVRMELYKIPFHP